MSSDPPQKARVPVGGLVSYAKQAYKRNATPKGLAENVNSLAGTTGQLMGGQNAFLKNDPKKLSAKPKTGLDTVVATPCFLCWIRLCGIFLALLFFALFGYVAVVVWKWTTPLCERPYGRLCNGRGQCVNGACICEPLFSGMACTDNQILGYSLPLDRECNGNGFAYPFVNQTLNCYEYVEEGLRYGPGWASAQCQKFITDIRAEVTLRGGNPLVVPASIYVPMCVCQPGWSGPACDVGSCPSDENGYVCGQNGNTSVGILKNYTRAGEGCQCSTPLGLFRPQYYSQLTAAQRAIVQQRFYADFAQLYCGVAIFRQGVLTVWTPSDSYKCYCDDGWQGVTCTEGQCPFNPQSRAICYGRGAPQLGQGRLLNTTLSTHRRLPCEVQCAEGTERCQLQKCQEIQSPAQPLYTSGRYCLNPYICPLERPVRCWDGSCQPFPTLQAQGCVNQFVAGSLDHGRLDVAASTYTCQNITSNATYTACFGQNTTVDGVVSYLERGGVEWNGATTLEADLGSPLLLMELVTNFTGPVTVTNFDGQFQTEEGGGLLSFSFSYTDSQFWLEVNTSTVTLTEQEEGFYACPMPWNYTGSVSVPSNYSLLRLRAPAKALTVQVVPFTSTIEIFPFTAQETWVLVQSPNEGLYLHPIGLEVTKATCLSEPAECSWYQNGTALRSLDSAYWICSVGGLPSIQTTPCLSLVALETYVESWRTCASVQPTIDLTFELETFTQLERNDTFRTQFPFSVSFGAAQNTTVSILDPLLLTKARMTYPCACPNSLREQNRTALNELWWTESGVREVTFDSVEVGDWVLGGDFTDGDRDLVRAQVVTFSEEGNSFLLQDPKTLYTFGAYRQAVRRMGVGEVLLGMPDCDLLEQPGRCPDGSCTRQSLEVVEVDASCNCTYTPPLTFCGCLDTYNFTFQCQCNSTVSACQCALPATSDFELDLWEEVSSVTTTGCNCLIYTSLNTTLSLTETSGVFQIETDQVPTHVVLTSTGTDFSVVGQSYLFANVSINFTYDYVHDTGEWWLTLYTNPSPGFSRVVVSATGMSTATLLLSPQAFSLFQVEPEPTFRASSNSQNASNVNLLNSSYWLSSTYDLPIFLEVDMGRYTYPNTTTVVFYQAGNNSVADHIFFQGQNQGKWYTLGGMGAYVEKGGWLEKQVTVENNTMAFSKYRLISLGAQFGVRRWDIFAQQLCQCDDEAILTLQLSSLEGVPTLQGLLGEIAYYRENMRDDVNCTCVDECYLTVGANLTANFANDGLCQDLSFIGPYMGFDLQIEPVVSQNQTVNGYELVDYTDFSETLAVVQFANDSSLFLDKPSLVLIYPSYLEGLNTIQNATNGSQIVGEYYFFQKSDFLVVPFDRQSGKPQQTYYNGTFVFLFTFGGYAIGTTETSGLACASGYDCTDCGPSNRIPSEFGGYTCSLTDAQATLLGDIEDGNVLVNKTLYIRNLTGLTFTALYQDISLARRVSFLTLEDCPLQMCPMGVPFRCTDGSCATTPASCRPLYNCPGNGCVEQTDVSGLKAFRCACTPGYAGDGCQFGQCLSATPYQKFGTPASEECTCGGPPPLREKPPVLNINQELTPSTVVQLNNHITGNSAPRSALDVDYLRVMPQNGPWGRVLRYKYTYTNASSLSSALQRTIYTSCPFMRRGYFGEYIFLTDDVLTRDQVSGRVTSWRQYINPVTGVTETFPWQSIATYNDFPYRCPNGQCVRDESFCASSVQLYPLCNGRGICNADGTCTCSIGWKTYSVNDVYSLSIRYPYAVVNGVPNPTVWELNWNWKHHGLNQCTARDCEVADCTAPLGCFPGTPSLNFADRLVLCTRATGVSTVCAPSLQACMVSEGLTAAVRCNGKGIPRTKDFTGEQYCACGDPISPTLNITAVTQITQLKSNGWGGSDCSSYYATNGPVLWSPWNFEIDAPYRSLVTGRALPGIWKSGIRIMGPDPDDRLVWESCCPGISRLEECPNVPCLIKGKIECRASANCIAPNTPLVYACNNHGDARADGTCECESSEAKGEGYTHDYSQFSVKGCYKFVRCPLSQLNGASCNYQPACTKPGEWLHPLSYDPYLEEQWFTCGVGGQGLYTNETRLQFISANLNGFNTQLEAALSNIALDVITQETALASCICVYPNDTTNSKFGMLPGASLAYQQNYAAPYYLNGSFPLWPNLTDGNLESLGYESHTFISGDILEFYLANTASTYVKAFRIFGLVVAGAPSATLTTTSGTALCGSAINFETTSTLQWSSLEDGVRRCGPFYQCLDISTQPGFESECLVKDSVQCEDWKEQTCTATFGNVYWPLDSQAIYQGCIRGNEECTCCQLLPSAANPTVDNGIIQLRITNGSVQIGQVQFYGYTSRALAPPLGLKETIARKFSGGLSDCQDYIFYSSYLAASGDPYAAQLTNQIQQPIPLTGAKDACVYTGGFLAADVTTNLALLQRVCSNIRQDGSRCWVAGRDVKLNDLYIGRDELFNTGCTKCTDTLRLRYNKRYFTFSTYPDTPAISNDFKQEMISGQFSTKTVLNRFTGDRTGDVTATFFDPIQIEECCIIEWVHRTQYFYPETQIRKESYPLRRCFGESGNAYGMHLYTTPIRFSNQRFDNVQVSVPGLASVIGWETRIWYGIETVPRGCAATGLFDAPPTRSSTPNIFITDQVPQGSFFQRAKTNYGSETDGFGYSFQAASSGLGNNAFFWAVPWNVAPFQNGNPRLVQYTLYANTNPTTSGSFGIDFFPGYDDYQYLPVFMRSEVVNCILIFSGGTFGTCLDGRETFELQNTIPYYFKQNPFLSQYVRLADTIGTFSYPTCSSCIKTLEGDFQWNSYLYSVGSWPTQIANDFDYVVNILTPRALGYRSLPYLYLETSSDPDHFIAAHQITYIESRDKTTHSASRRASTSVPWRLNSCVIVGPRPISSSEPYAPLELAVCEETSHQYLCSYDYVKYTTVSGYSCPDCGPNGRSGAEPLPGVTCYDEFPLANASAYPYQHSLKTAYITGTLDLYAESFNTQVDEVDFGNTSTIWGYRAAWLLWKEGFSSRAGQLSRGTPPQSNWCDMCVDCNWPVDCGLQRDPVTNVQVRYCASNQEYCNLDAPVAPSAPVRDMPPLFDHTLDQFLTTDPTCGYVFLLNGYLQTNKDGVAQDMIEDYFVPLELSDTYVQLQVKAHPAYYFNGGKSSNNFKFETNVTTYVSGKYFIQECVACTSPTLEVFIHPLSPFYSFPSQRISVLVPLVQGQLRSFVVSFTVSQSQSGSQVINGQTFPAVVYRQVGFGLTGMGVGSSLYIYNPLATTNTTQALCQNRTMPAWKEPRTRILSTAPLHKCILSDDDLLDFPGGTIGSCACALNAAGRTCDCPAVQSKYGKEVCGGVGDQGVAVRGFDGRVYTSGIETDAGCFVLESISDCKTIDLARAAFTLLTPGAVWEYPSVFVQRPPTDGDGVFIILPNVDEEWLAEEEVRVDCLAEAASMPYYSSADELNQLLQENLFSLPVFMGTESVAGLPLSIPWSEAAALGGYFINTTTFATEVASVAGDYVCSDEVDFCQAINFNNWAYRTSPTNGVVDGNTIDLPSPNVAGTIILPARAPLETTVVGFGGSSILCFDGTACESCATSGLVYVCLCRCANRKLSYGTGFKEIQVFDSQDQMRSAAYTYS